MPSTYSPFITTSGELTQIFGILLFYFCFEICSDLKFKLVDL